MRRRAGIVLALLLVLTGCTPAEPAGPAAEPAAEPVYMALTFDDGPSPSNTPRLLEGLSRRGVRATFFLVGSRIEGREDLVRRIRQEGHQIGNHSFGHGDLTDLSAAQALADLIAPSDLSETNIIPSVFDKRVAPAVAAAVAEAARRTGCARV